MSTSVEDNQAASRFEITVDGELAGYLDYREYQGEYALSHVRVMPQYQGRGVGSELVVSALRTIQERRGTVLPYCPFVPPVIRKHPEFIDLVPEDERDTFGLAAA